MSLIFYNYMRKELLSILIICIAVFIFFIQYYLILSIITSLLLLVILSIWLKIHWKNQSLFIINENTFNVINNGSNIVLNIDDITFFIIEKNSILDLYVNNVSIHYHGKLVNGFLLKEKEDISKLNISKKFIISDRKKGFLSVLETYK